MSTDAAIGGMIVGGVLGAMYIIYIVIYVLIVIANWKIFTKAGEKGWKSIIPVYNLYTQYKLTWKPFMTWPVIILLGAGGYMTNDPSNTVLTLIGGLVLLAGFVLYVISLNKLSKSFDKGAGFTVGLVLLGPIFYMILGFGKATYIGNTCMKA